MAYVPNAEDPTEPLEARTVESAALEFRTLKTKVIETSDAILTTLRDASNELGTLPSVALRAGKVLAFDAGGNPAVASIGTNNDSGLREDLASAGGAELVGYLGGLTVADQLGVTVSLQGSQVISGFKQFNAGIALGVDLPISDGGTGASTAAAAFDNLKQDATTSASGVVELATNLEVQTGTDSTRAVTPASFRAANIMIGTAVATTSGTAVDFTGIPSWAKRVTIMFAGVSTSGTSGMIVQVGAGSITASGYSSAGSVVSSAGTAAATSSTGFLTAEASSLATYTRHGIATLCSMGNNLWAFSSVIGNSETARTTYGGGSIQLSGVLDRIRITTVSGGDTFDAGSVNILWE